MSTDTTTTTSGGIGSTLIGGIQNLAAILPLLFTEQCSEQVTSALTRGYLYAAATPLSIFGSLGVVSAGFKTLIACLSSSFGGGNIEGAKIFGNMGFEPQGENLSLIMVDKGNGNEGNAAGRYIIETRIDELIKELNIDKNRIIGVSHKSDAWNVKMITSTAFLCVISILPYYIYLNQGANDLEDSSPWEILLPVFLRAIGGFITVVLIQLLIQRRITTLSYQYLVKRVQLPKRGDLQRHTTDVEAAGDTKKLVTATWRIAPTWLLLCLLPIGLVTSILGYVGWFIAVRNSTSTNGPVSWFSFEVGLAVVRLAIWAWNPTKDDAPPLEIILELDTFEHNPLLNCTKDDEEILAHKVLPLTRSQDFLKMITSFAGLMEPFNNPDLSLYYTLTTRNHHPSEKSSSVKFGGEWNLYITVFDLKEHTTRIYTRDHNERDVFYSTKTDAPLVNIKLEVEIGTKYDPKYDPVYNDSKNMDSLRKHYRSILDSIQYRLAAEEDGFGGRGGDVIKPYVIENNWTMKVEDTISTFQRLREEEAGYFMQHPVVGGASIEREREEKGWEMDEKRVEWITSGMEMMITKETKERFQVKTGVEEY